MNRIPAVPLDRHLANIAAAKQVLDDKLPTINTLISELNTAIKHFNTCGENFAEFIDSVVTDAEEHAATRGEKWQDSPAGEQYYNWIERLRDCGDFEIACTVDPAEIIYGTEPAEIAKIPRTVSDA